MKKEKTRKEALKYNVQRSEEGGSRLPKGILPERESWTCVQEAQERVFLEPGSLGLSPGAATYCVSLGKSLTFSELISSSVH